MTPPRPIDSGAVNPGPARPCTRATREARDRDDHDRGAATIWAVGVIAVLLTVVVFALSLGAAILARHQAQSAADLAALAGAAAMPAPEQAACAQAQRITDRMRVRLVSCHTSGWDVLVETGARPGGRIGGLGYATGRARAGPVGP